jgi:hypothetical protein
MRFRKSPQIPALASISSPHLAAKAISAASDNVPDFSAFLAHRHVAAVAPELRLWESAGYSNQVYSMICLEMRC